MSLVDIRREVQAGQGATDRRAQSVSPTFIHWDQITDRPLDPSQVSVRRRWADPRAYISVEPLSGNRLPLNRGSVSVALS